MLLFEQFIFFLIYCFVSNYALRYSTNCSSTYNLTTPFYFPDQCHQRISAGTSLASLTFWYDREEDSSDVSADLSATIASTENKRHAFLLLPPSNSKVFYYNVDYACRNTNDRARDLITNTANEMQKQQSKFLAIINEMTPLTLGRPLLSNHTDLLCFDSKERVRQCAVATKLSSCIIFNNTIGDEIFCSCMNRASGNDVSVSIYQTDTYALQNTGV